MTIDHLSLLEPLRQVLAAGPPLRLAVLFGSQARDAVHPESDVDIGIIPRDADLPLSTELELQASLERACKVPVDLVRLDRASSLLRWEVARKSILIVADSPREFSRFVAEAALDHADLMTTLAPAAEHFRRHLAGRSVKPNGDEAVLH